MSKTVTIPLEEYKSLNNRLKDLENRVSKLEASENLMIRSASATSRINGLIMSGIIK